MGIIRLIRRFFKKLYMPVSDVCQLFLMKNIMDTYKRRREMPVIVFMFTDCLMFNVDSCL